MQMSLAIDRHRPAKTRLALLASTVLVAVVVGGLVGYGLGVPLPLVQAGTTQASPICAAYKPLPPAAGGVVRAVRTAAELDTALAQARPGDTINVASGTFSELAFRESLGHANGTPSAPIIIQAADGARPIVDYGDPLDPALKPAVYVAKREHVMIRGFEVRNRTFGMLAANSHHITFEYNDVHSTGHAGIVAQAFYNDQIDGFSSNITIRCNRIHQTGQHAPEFGEGIYVGTGSGGTSDRTNNVRIEANEIFETSNEGIDVKRYTSEVAIVDNYIHDVTPYYGGAISLGLNKDDWGPANYLVDNNKIWNVSNGLHYAQAIAVAHGPTTIRNNTIWNIATSPESSWPWTHDIQIHGDNEPADWAYGFGNPAHARVEIINNTVWGCAAACIDSYTDAGMVAPVVDVSGNLVSRPSSRDAATDRDVIVARAMFQGPLDGTADAGSGPGTGFELIDLPFTDDDPRPDPGSTTTTLPPTSSSNTTTASTPTTAVPPTTSAVASTSTSTTFASTTLTSATVAPTTGPSSTSSSPSTLSSTTTVPSTTVPSTTVPSTTVPSTAVPSTTVPSTVAPSTPGPVSSTTTPTTSGSGGGSVAPTIGTTNKPGKGAGQQNGKGWKRFGRGKKSDHIRRGIGPR